VAATFPKSATKHEVESDAPFLLTPDNWFILGSAGSVTADFAFSVMLCGLLWLQGSTDLIPHALACSVPLESIQCGIVAFRGCWTRTNRVVAVFVSVSAILYTPCHHKDPDHQS